MSSSGKWPLLSLALSCKENWESSAEHPSVILKVGYKIAVLIFSFKDLQITDPFYNISSSGYVELPDGKVLTGSEWGNMLLWDGDLIKVELSEHEGQKCHGGMIQEIFLDEGELITAGADGRVKVHFQYNLS